MIGAVSADVGAAVVDFETEFIEVAVWNAAEDVISIGTLNRPDLFRFIASSRKWRYITQRDEEIARKLLASVQAPPELKLVAGARRSRSDTQGLPADNITTIRRIIAESLNVGTDDEPPSTRESRATRSFGLTAEPERAAATGASGPASRKGFRNTARRPAGVPKTIYGRYIDSPETPIPWAVMQCGNATVKRKVPVTRRAIRQTMQS